jgi:glutaredoxin/glutathione-dependent peroxiredoxin
MRDPTGRTVLGAQAVFLEGDMMGIQAGDRLPDGTLTELIEQETPGCSLGPNSFRVADLLRGKRIVIIGVPGAFTPTCSNTHLPGYVANAEAFKTKGVDEIWCVAVNDAFVMGAWGKQQGASGKVRMLADGNGAYTKSLGLELDLTARNMGIRSQRYSMLVEDGVVRRLHLEKPGKFEVSAAEALLVEV